MSTLYLVIGCIVEILAVFGVLYKLSIIITIIRLELWKTSNFFITALASLFNDLLLGLLFSAYIGPSIIAESYFFEKGLDSLFLDVLSILLLYFWFVEGLLQIIVTLHRFIVVRYSIDIKRFIIVLFCLLPYVLSCPLLFFILIKSDCCRVAVDWKHFGFFYHNPQNLANSFSLTVILPLAAVPAIFSVLLYSLMICHLYSAKKSVQPFLIQVQVRQKEKRFTLEYFCVVLANAIGWLLFFATQSIPSTLQQDWMFCIYPLFIIIKLQILASILLKYHNEIRLRIFKRFIDKTLPPVFTNKRVTTTPVQMLTRNPTI